MTRKIPIHAIQQTPANDTTVVDKTVRKMTYAIHTSLLFSPHQKAWLTNVSVQVDKQTGLIISVHDRATKDADIEDDDVDLRAYTVLPGFGEFSNDGVFAGNCGV